jgi:hypothetical protein
MSEVRVLEYKYLSLIDFKYRIHDLRTSLSYLLSEPNSDS